MTRWIILALFLLSIVNAQDVPPPPKPEHDGPTLGETMKFIEEKLNGQRRVNWVATYENSTSDWTSQPLNGYYEISEVRGDVSSCAFTLRETGEAGVLRMDGPYRFALRDVDRLTVSTWAEAWNKAMANRGRPEMTSDEPHPSVFALAVHMNTGKSVQRLPEDAEALQRKPEILRRYYFEEREASHIIVFRDYDLADRVAKALTHAVEVCGGGSKEPF